MGKLTFPIKNLQLKVKYWFQEQMSNVEKTWKGTEELISKDK